MKLKQASTNDLDYLTRLFKSLREDEPMDDKITDKELKSLMKSFLEGDTYEIYFLVEENKILGYGMVDITRKPKYLRHLYICRDSRRKGNGKKLIQLLMDLYEIDVIDIDVMIWNENAINFYKKLGFYSRYCGMRLKKIK